MRDIYCSMRSYHVMYALAHLAHCSARELFITRATCSIHVYSLARQNKLRALHHEAQEGTTLKSQGNPCLRRLRVPVLRIELQDLPICHCSGHRFEILFLIFNSLNVFNSPIHLFRNLFLKSLPRVHDNLSWTQLKTTSAQATCLMPCA